MLCMSIFDMLAVTRQTAFVLRTRNLYSRELCSNNAALEICTTFIGRKTTFGNCNWFLPWNSLSKRTKDLNTKVKYFENQIAFGTSSIHHRRISFNTFESVKPELFGEEQKSEHYVC